MKAQCWSVSKFPQTEAGTCTKTHKIQFGIAIYCVRCNQGDSLNLKHFALNWPQSYPIEATRIDAKPAGKQGLSDR